MPRSELPSIEQRRRAQVSIDAARALLRDAVAECPEIAGQVAAAHSELDGATRSLELKDHGEPDDPRSPTERRLSALLVERETQFEELYHRVKNHLGMIDSLLQLQADATVNEQAGRALREASNRVHVIAEAHRLLHETADLVNIELAGYLDVLARALYGSLVVAPERVTLAVNADRASLDVRRAVPLALVLNELLTNAFKHAFPGERAGTVRVSLSTVDDAIELTVADDGIGMPERSQATSLGLRLVRVLAAQLHGSIAIESRHGTAARVRVPLRASRDHER